jgi:pimeloyl-ACP methyl ester carboxylesterase
MSDPYDANLAQAKIDLAAAQDAGDEILSALLDTLIGCGGQLVLYRPELHRYGVIFGDLGQVGHVAVMVPGVGNQSNLCHDWIPSAHNLYEAAAPSAAVILWKGYDNPVDLLAAAAESIECNAQLMAGGAELAEFVNSLSLHPHQTLTVVAHSYGSVVTGLALADHDLRCTDVVVAGSPGMTVDDLRALHIDGSHFFSEQAPGDAIAELGIFGSAPSAPTFGGTRMRTNAPGHVDVHAHSNYFVPGSEALENIVNVVTGRYDDVVTHHSTVPEIAGGLVAWTMRLPTVPIRAVGRRYRGPGFRVLANVFRFVDLSAAQAGGLVRDALQEGESTLEWMTRRVVGERGDPER